MRRPLKVDDWGRSAPAPGPGAGRSSKSGEEGVAPNLTSEERGCMIAPRKTDNATGDIARRSPRGRLRAPRGGLARTGRLTGFLATSAPDWTPADARLRMTLHAT